MFYKARLPKEVYQLFIEAYACSVPGEALDKKVKALHQWLREYADQKVVVNLLEAASMRHDEIIAQRLFDAKAEEEAEKAKKPEPRKVVVPDDKAEEILRLWNVWTNKCGQEGSGSCLAELYALEKALYAACPEILKWDNTHRYFLDVVQGKVVVIEETE